jgi:hypothetical protein
MSPCHVHSGLSVWWKCEDHGPFMCVELRTEKRAQAVMRPLELPLLTCPGVGLARLGPVLVVVVHHVAVWRVRVVAPDCTMQAT